VASKGSVAPGGTQEVRARETTAARSRGQEELTAAISRLLDRVSFGGRWVRAPTDMLTGRISFVTSGLKHGSSIFVSDYMVFRSQPGLPPGQISA
jgi:hypothetical protein